MTNNWLSDHPDLHFSERDFFIYALACFLGGSCNTQTDTVQCTQGEICRNGNCETGITYII